MSNSAVDSEVMVLGQREVALFGSMLSGIRDITEGDYSDILFQLANATDAASLDAAFSSDSLKDYINAVVVINDIKKAPSDFEGGLGYFLILYFVDEETGESCVATTGATSIVAQLCVAHARNMLPLRCKVMQKDKPTKKGYYPMHLQTSGL